VIESQADLVRDDPFFIGWLPVPSAHRRFLLVLAAVLVVLAGTTAALIAWMQSSPGTGEWQTGPRSFEGVLVASPYAMLRIPGFSPGDPERTLLLVEEGKFGALPRALELLGGRSARGVRANGTVLHRDGRWMVELAEGDEGLRLLSPREEQRLLDIGWPAPVVVQEQVVLHGEIIDPKCYLGAMKPGGGKTHKGCAALCIRGGVPPMLVTRTGGEEVYHLLVTAEGGQASEMVLPFVGDTVTVRGRLERDGDLLRLAVAANGVQRR
jgi:hypothetical protein